MPTVDLSLKGLLEGNFFNFLLLLGVLVFVLVKFNVKNVINQSQKNVEEILKKSDEEKSESESVLESAKQEVEKLPAKLEQIKQEAQNTVESFRKATQQEIAQTAERLESNAQKSIENEVQRINSELQRETAISAIAAVHKKTLDKLSTNADLHRKFIDEAINKIEELEI